MPKYLNYGENIRRRPAKEWWQGTFQEFSQMEYMMSIYGLVSERCNTNFGTWNGLIRYRAPSFLEFHAIP